MNADQRMTKADEQAWRWFAYHAEQRTNMFNYFLAASAILAAAMATAVGDAQRWLVVSLGLVGAIISACFIGLDLRNRFLVGLAEDVLLQIEHATFADDAGHPIAVGARRLPDGILLRDLDPSKSTRKDPSNHSPRWQHHSVLLPVVEGLFFVAFLAAAISVLARPSLLASESGAREERMLVEIADRMGGLATRLDAIDARLAPSPPPASTGAAPPAGDR